MLNIKLINEIIKSDGGTNSVNNLDDAYKFCEKMARSHYENFPVASRLVPKKYRKHILAVYCFARLADDIADEYLDSTQKIIILKTLEKYLRNKNKTSNPIFLALQNTIKEKNLPLEPFLNLLKAFRMDAEFSQPEAMDDVLNYCKYSANPVGELVLRIFDECTEEKLKYSNDICTALQLANFWQDFARDIPNGRFYIPKNIAGEKVLKNNPDEIFDELKKLYNKTEELFFSGSGLINLLENRLLKIEIALTISGGELILKKTRKLGQNIFHQRPEISKREFILPLFKAILLKENVSMKGFLSGMNSDFERESD
jgi:hydroxysqualene synthase